MAFALVTAEELEDSEPKTFREAVASTEKKLWWQSMREEMDSLDKNGTWKLVEKPRNQKIVGCKWVYKLKEGIAGVEKPRYKSRLVAKCFTQ